MNKSQENLKLRRSPDSAGTIVYYATRSGGTTLDTGESGGNPFAGALIEVAAQKTLRLQNLGTKLCKHTKTMSNGHQIPECNGDIHLPNWRFHEDHHRKREKRSALILIVSDYSASALGAPLLGAARDERRIASMLARYGFSVIQGIGPKREELIQALRSFRHQSKDSDVAIIYSTGHGVESDGMIYLLPGDYPIHEGYRKDQLRTRAVTVDRIIRAASAREQNIVFFAGCRTKVCILRNGL